MLLSYEAIVGCSRHRIETPGSPQLRGQISKSRRVGDQETRPRYSIYVVQPHHMHPVAAQLDPENGVSRTMAIGLLGFR
jgi:hypothetical protein